MTGFPRTLGPFEYAALCALREGLCYGAAVRRRLALSDRGDGRPFTARGVYTALHRLEKKGFVRSEMDETTRRPAPGGRRRRVYRIEPAGLRAMLCYLQRVGVAA